MSYTQSANRAIAQQRGGRRRDWAQRLSRGAPRRPLLSALVPLVTLHAKSDDSEELWPSSKMGKRMCVSILLMHLLHRYRPTIDAVGPLKFLWLYFSLC